MNKFIVGVNCVADAAISKFISLEIMNDQVQRDIKEKKECFKRLHLDKSAANIEAIN